MTARTEDMVSIPRAELDALRAENRRLRREAGDAEALRRIRSDSGEGRTFTREELAEAWELVSDRVLRFPDRTWDELEGLPQPLRNAQDSNSSRSASIPTGRPAMSRSRANSPRNRASTPPSSIAFTSLPHGATTSTAPIPMTSNGHSRRTLFISCSGGRSLGPSFGGSYIHITAPPPWRHGNRMTISDPAMVVLRGISGR